jgi:hypothetical protein
MQRKRIVTCCGVVVRTPDLFPVSMYDSNMYDRRDLGSSPRQVISVPPYKLTCTSVYPTYKDKTAQDIDSGSEALLEG